MLIIIITTNTNNLLMLGGPYSPRHSGKSHSVVSDSLRPMDYRVHGILQARILETAAIPFSRGSPQSRD